MRLVFYIIAGFLLLSALATPAQANYIQAAEDELTYIREEVETIASVSKYAQALSEVPANVTIITSDEIERFGYRDLSDILNSVPGAYITYDRTMSYIGMRGFGRPGDYNSRVLLLINGHPVNDDIYGSADFDFSGPVDIDLISRVEVIKGPGYLYFGNNAIFAVINIVTKKPSEIDGLMFSTEAGSLSTYKGSATYGRTLNGYDIVLHASYSGSRGKERIYFPEHSENDGLAEASDKYRHRAFYARLKKDNFQLQGAFRDYDKYIPTASNLTIFNSREQRWNPEYAFLELSYKGVIRDDLEYTLRGFYNSHVEKFTFPYADPDYFMWLDNPRSHHYGLEVRMDWKATSKSRVMLGAEARNTHAELKATDLTNDMTFVDAARTFVSYSLFGQYELRLSDRLISFFGLRYDNYTSLYTRFKSVLLPYAAMTFTTAASGAFKLSYSEAYRTPSLFESFYITDTPDGPYGNADLNIEKCRLVTGIYEKALSDRISLNLNLFKYWINNLIDSQESATGGVIYDNVASKTIGTGGEAGISIRGYGGIRGDMSYSYQRVSDNINGQLLNSPLHLAKGRLSLPVYSRVVLGVEGLYVAKRKKAVWPEEWVSAYGVVNANISAKNIYKGADVSFGIYNLFDAKYSDPVGADNYPIKAVEQNGRTFRAKLSYTF